MNGKAEVKGGKEGRAGIREKVNGRKTT